MIYLRLEIILCLLLNSEVIYKDMNSFLFIAFRISSNLNDVVMFQNIISLYSVINKFTCFLRTQNIQFQNNNNNNSILC